MMRIVAYMVLAALVLLHCSGSSPVAGGSTDTGNARVLGSVMSAQGVPVSGALVRMRPIDYVATADNGRHGAAVVFDERTDSQGALSIESVTPGHYIIEVNDGDSTAVLLQLRVDDTSRVISLPPATMRPFAVVRGNLRGSLPAQSGWGYVQVYGLERMVAIDSTGRFIIGDLPQGDFTLRGVVQGPQPKLLQLDSVQTAAGDTVDVKKYAIWNGSRSIHINTSPSGAYLSVPVENFPLLVRLDATNFDFSQAQRQGQDIRFTDSEGTPLAHDIEWWDALQAQAVIWVKIPLVQPDNDSQFIRLFWANPAARSTAAPAQVFDSTNGFVGVWHLSDFSDHSAHRAHLTPVVQPAFIPGVVGAAYAFDGVDDTLSAGDNPALAVKDRMTLSMWVQFAAADSARTMRLISKKDANWQPGGYSLEVVPDARDTAGIRLYGNDADYARSGPRSWQTGRWYYLVVVYDGGQARFYVDGVQLDAVDSTLLPLTADNERLYLGGWEESFLKGALDEVTIARVVRSAHWVALSYQNQRSAQRLVEFR